MSPAISPRVAVYTGSFDPITLGHLDVISRGSVLFDQLVVGIGINPEKRPLFSPQERVELVEGAIEGLDNVRVQAFTGLAVRFVRSCGARVMLRGVRSLSDTESEFTMSMANRQLDRELETVFLMADEAFSHVSSSLIKQIAKLADEESLERFVPKNVIQPLREKIQATKANG
ncbi:Phosphopantetheine adenylyltransferase [Planctomycetales bacterium 10988]|nr:Phosphopantetheine adenylyltransferase [Planctomycetales bacterium 10988]